MPIYDYKCEDCGYTFEARQRMTDDPLTECPSCDEGEVRRVVNAVGVVFKGSGFYITDNRNGKGKSGASASAVNGADSGKSEEKTSEQPKAEKKKEKETTTSDAS